MKILLTALLLSLLPPMAMAADCEALKHEESYEGKYKSLKFLIEGKDGWIFRSKQDLRARFALDEKGWRLLSDLQETFRKKGAELIIAFPPTRGMAAPSMVPAGAGYDARSARREYGLFLESARARDLLVAGTPEIRSGEHYFYKADHHWTTYGAREMAQSVADMVKALPVYKKLRKTGFSTREEEAKVLKGVLAAPVEELCGTHVEDLQDIVYRTSAQAGDLGEEDLFSDAVSPQVVLVGTSNSKRDRLDMNFEGFLKKYMSADIYNAALAGAGMEDPMLAYLETEHFRSGRARVIIWEIPGYYNLSSDRSKDALRQIMAAMKGPCRSPLLKSAVLPVSQENVSVLSGLADRHILPKDIYLVMTFDRPLTLNGFLTLSIGDHVYETFKFKRSRKYPPSAVYYYKPEYRGQEGLADLSVKFPDDRKDVTFRMEVCHDG